jgi:hypothetical protein
LRGGFGVTARIIVEEHREEFSKIEERAKRAPNRA